jgi:glycosyltransferase involved in cell wall biosynthesis
VPAAFQVRNLYEPSHADRSDRVRHAVARLHKQHHFNVIEFAVTGGLGFRAIQAKRAGLAFDDVTLAVRLDGCSQQAREQQERWPSGLEEVELDYTERYSFENADQQVTPCPDAVAYVRKLGWRVLDNAPDVGPVSPGNDTPLVTVGIAHYNLGPYLPAALATLAAQTYPHLEVIVIDDGSTDRGSLDTLAELEAHYPQYRFLRQSNAGIGVTRNRCLAEARGELFIPMDADNLARPDMVERFVRGILRNPDLSAMTCYFLAFEGDGTDTPESFLYANRPTGGPHAMAGIRNVYGDANAIFRTADFREVGGYETDRGTSCEDWEAFVKLVHAGKRIGVIPDHLFYYRHRAGGFSRATNWFANHQRVLRQFRQIDHLSSVEAATLWTTLLGFQQHAAQLAERQRCRRYRIADRLHGVVRRLKRLVTPRS